MNERSHEPNEADVVAALDPNGAPIKYGEIAAGVATATGMPGEEAYRKVDRILQRMKRDGRAVLVKGRGGGWRLSDVALAEARRP